MDKYHKSKFWRPGNKIKINPNLQKKGLDDQLNNEKKILFQKLILNLRNKIKYTILTFFNSKKYNL